VIGRKEGLYATNRLVLKRGVTQNHQWIEKTIKLAAGGPQQKEKR